ncbi:hypothetical protein RDWZM_007278 [Blomia tropicalis]|uniref:F-box domain-containing protein n=1 Tax=Blomia tropicalis TaxID=40697 RepID=A0A9Q0LZJ2_BLOTA|nr:hypothetical protein RDWZM_007278 [Blomia tropicalis]
MNQQEPTVKTMMMSIDNLPNDCLRLILIRCPLSQLVHLRAVSFHWCSVIETIFKKKKTLKLFGSSYDIEKYLYVLTNFKAINTEREISLFNFEADSLIISETKPELACYEIVKLFPNVRNLYIRCYQLFRIEQLGTVLFQQLCNQLNLLWIYGLPANGIVPHSFWSSIGQMSALKRLFLIRVYNCHIPSQLTIFQQLNQLVLTHNLQDVNPILIRLKSIQTLKLNMINYNCEKLDQLLEANPLILKNLISLGLGTITCSNINRLKNFKLLLNRFCVKFHEIRTLDLIMADQIPLIELIPIISQLKQLNQLWLYIGRHQLECDNNEDEDNEHNQHNHGSSLFYRIPQLLTVQTLYLEIYDVSIEQFIHWIGSLFPNVKVLTIKCEYDRNERIDLRSKSTIEFKQLEQLYFA